MLRDEYVLHLYFLFLFIFLATPHGMWDLSFLTRNGTGTPVVEAQSPNCWTTREVPVLRL